LRPIGINVTPNIIYGVDNFMNCIAANGFNSIFSFGTDPAFVGHLAKVCADNHMSYDTLHAPWDRINDLWYEPSDGGKFVLDEFKRTVDYAKEYGVPVVIAHISSKEDAPTVTDIGLKRFDEFVNYAAKNNIKIAVENQRKLGNIATILEIYGRDTNVGFCWDVGHEKCFAGGKEYMALFGDRCIATHIHDNMCVYNSDDHLLPFDGAIDYRRTADLFKEHNYQGTLMLEIKLPKAEGDTYSELSLEQFTAKAYAAINRIRIISEY